MTAYCVSDEDHEDYRWRLVGSKGCCSFEVVFEAGKGVVRFDGGCHRCLNELNAFALERRIVVQRLPQLSPSDRSS